MKPTHTPHMTLLELTSFLDKECSTYEAGLLMLSALNEQAEKLGNDGWVVMRCVQMDSSRCGECWLMPVGGTATWQEIPMRPVSKRGLASDMAVAERWIPVGLVNMFSSKQNMSWLTDVTADVLEERKKDEKEQS